MEDLDLVKTEQDTSSVDTNIRHAHNSVGCDLSSNRSGPSPSPNGVSCFSGKASPAVIPGEVGLLASFLPDPQRSGDSETLKNCETKWLHFFRLVEKQCQEQINAQQKQFYQQIYHIQNEIRHLVKLQNQNACSCTQRSFPAKHADSSFPLKNPMGLQSETSEENELLVHHLNPNEAESQPEASASPTQQECLTNSLSTSSGYGTCSAAELSPVKPKDIRACMESPGEVTSRQDSAASMQKVLVTASVHNKKEFTHPAIEHGLPQKDNTVFPAETERKISEGQCGRAGCKPLTSWAQKLKQTQQKRANAEEEEVYSVDGKEQTKTLTFENTSPSAAAPPSSTFYLNRQNGSQNSLVSDISGLTYWKLDEKEMYLSLPENLENEFNINPAMVSPEQSSSGDEVKPSSLKEIYHKKQRERNRLPDWSFPPSQSTHPPEILTLDPTLHMKPGQQNPGLPSRGFYMTPEKVPFSPDSMADPAFFTHSDTDSFSRTSTVTSPESAGSPKYDSNRAALQADPWNGCAFQNEAEDTSGSYPAAFSHPSHEISDAEDEDNLTLTPSSVAQSRILSGDNSLAGYGVPVTRLEDPLMLSKIKQNLREKHARHIADLRAYYDSEIQSLKQQLEASHKLPSEDLKEINQSLADRCDQLQVTLNDANHRMRALENKNNALETEVTDWRERFSIVSGTAMALREQVEEARASSKEKDNTLSRLKRRLKDLEEAFEKAYKLSDNREARLREENKMFQNLLGEYESLGKEHERVKDTLNITENKLLDAHAQISDLKRTVSKLEAQIKQLEHENLQKIRHLADSHLTAPSANKHTSSDVSRRKWLIPGAEYSIFTGQPLEAGESSKDNRLEDAYAAYRNYSPPEKDSSPDPLLTNEVGGKEREVPEAPILKAIKQLEERKALKSWGTQTEKEGASSTKSTSRRLTVGFDETAISAARSSEKGRDQHRHKRYSSPCSQRSSSLPPSNRKSNTPNTPTRREIMLAPVAVTYSPKRSPKENLSPGFSQLLSKNENTVTRFDVLLDEPGKAPRPASQYSSPRKKLQFLSVGDTEEMQCRSPGKDSHAQYSPGTDSLHAGGERGTLGPAWGEETTRTSEPSPPSGTSVHEADFKDISRIKTLADTEKLFDELTNEKQQIEAQLIRMPCTGGRMSLQARLNQEALEDRLERINRELGSIRMILKRFHVLRTSANT
ncbi:M-phase phosphoprotein 9 [Heteronotia binoei]|uniref:M-phase phosphoprotein 9 n=1 Tax=Heteronotia binoei TaxID=13085 RepID=UPI00292ECC51|nr:M-phase phosphoprotein 9 [Heteronotia binoei]